MQEQMLPMFDWSSGAAVTTSHGRGTHHHLQDKKLIWTQQINLFTEK